MPLSEREEQAFRQIASQLSTDDPDLGVRLRRLSERISGASAVFAASAMTAGGLTLLPLAAETGLYPLGLAGYGLACLGVARGADLIRRVRWPSARWRAGGTGAVTSATARARVRSALGAMAAVVVLMMVFGSGTPSAPAGSTEPRVASASGTPEQGDRVQVTNWRYSTRPALPGSRTG
jgi:hypothetical protein